MTINQPHCGAKQKVEVSQTEDDTIIEFGLGKKGGFIGRKKGKVVMRRGGYQVQGRGKYLCEHFNDAGNYTTCIVVGKATLEKVVSQDDSEYKKWSDLAAEKRHKRRGSVMAGKEFALFVPGGAMLDQFNIYKID